MEITREEIRKAVLGNDTKRLAEILEEFGVHKYKSYRFLPPQKTVVVDVLSAASAAGYAGVLSKEMAHELIARFAMSVNIFDFLKLVDLCALNQNAEWDFRAIPRKIRKALMKSDYSVEIAHEIEDLDEDAFEALVAFIVNQLDELIPEFSIPIIHRVYEDEFLSDTMIFAYMGLVLRDFMDIETLVIAESHHD